MKPTWVALAILVFSQVFSLTENTNGHSRYALLSAMREDRSFRIDAYRDQTVDWARTPEGAYYSNKAPGPVFLAFPVFSVLDFFQTQGLVLREARDAERLKHRSLNLRILSLLLQVIPFVFLVATLLHSLQVGGIGVGQQWLVVLALCFGNTAALLMNLFFGHGLSAVAALAAWVFLRRERLFLAGGALGLLVLSDYAAVVFVPFLLVAALPLRRAVAWAPRLFAGALPCAILFAIYHHVCFGAWYQLPQKFQNPEFTETGRAVWGALSFLPSAEYLLELVVGFSRGLLWTEPLVLVVMVGLLFGRTASSQTSAVAEFRLSRHQATALAAGFMALLCLNASFNGWHGGDSPGPRYLSSLVPVLLLFVRPGRWAWFGLAVSGLFAVFHFCGFPLPPPGEPIWPYYLQTLLAAERTTYVVRFCVLLSFLGGLGAMTLRVTHKAGS